MKKVQTLFQSILFILSFLALGQIFYLLLTRKYDSENLIAILVFSFPVLLSFILSGSLLINRK
jgi:uncharacterized membrane protein